MIKRLYNYQLLPEIPEAAKKYRFIFVSGALDACNALYDVTSGIGKGIEPAEGCVYTVSEDGCAWQLERSYADRSGIFFHYQSITGNLANPWVNKDIPNSSGTIVFSTSDRGIVEYGFWDGGTGDSLNITKFTVPQGFHVAGKWRCIVSGTDSPVARMEWYRNNVLISTETGKSESECRPTADNVGVFTYHCVITFENGKSVTAGDMIMAVEAYEPGIDPGGGGYPDPGGGGGGNDETPLVTGIGLNVYPRTVVPGGRATVEVSVYGVGNYSQAFTAELSGNASAETELVAGENRCNVWISEEETADYVLITVTSEQDPYITATEMVYIDHDGMTEEDTTEEQLQGTFWKGYAAARAYFRDAKVSGSIHIAREEAEPTANAGKLRRSFWKGFVSALTAAAGHGAPDGVLISSDGYILTDCNGLYLCVKKQPVACLFNGVELLPLPEWDEETYPYAAITYRSSGVYYLSVYKSINYYETSGFFGAKSHWFGGNAENTSLVFTLGADGWTQQANTKWSISVDRDSSGDDLIWVNFDLMYSDDTLYMGASDPVPIY